MADTVEVKPKQFLNIVIYAGVLVLIGGGIFNLYNTFTGEFENVPEYFSWFFVGTAIIGVIAGFFLWAYFYQFRIIFDDEEIRVNGLKEKSISYGEISEIHVKKTYVYLKGNSRMQTVSIGNLFTNFKPSLEFLSNKFESGSEIEFSGNEEYIQEYFSPAEQ